MIWPYSRTGSAERVLESLNSDNYTQGRRTCAEHKRGGTKSAAPEPRIAKGLSKNKLDDSALSSMSG